MPTITLNARKTRIPVNAEIHPNNTGHIRKLLLARDGGVCARCGVKAEKWVADHIRPIAVFHENPKIFTKANLQTLCVPCDKLKTSEDRQRWPKHFSAGKDHYIRAQERNAAARAKTQANKLRKLSALNYEI